MAVMPAAALSIIRGRGQSAKPIRELLTARDVLQMRYGIRQNLFRRRGTEKSGIRLRQGHTTPIRAAANAALNANRIMTGTARSVFSLRHRAILIRALTSPIQTEAAQLTGQAISAAANPVTHGTVQHVQATARPHFPSAARQTPVHAMTRQVTSHGRKRLVPPMIGAELAHTATV